MNYDLFHSVVDQLVMLNTGLRRGVPEDVKETMSPVHWAVNFGTVHANIGRRSGKTEYILRRAKPSHLVVTFNRATRKSLMRGASCPVMSADEVAAGKAKDLRFDVVFVDEPDLVFRELPRSDLYRHLVCDYDQTFILLGA